MRQGFETQDDDPWVKETNTMQLPCLQFGGSFLATVQKRGTQAKSGESRDEETVEIQGHRAARISRAEYPKGESCREKCSRDLWVNHLRLHLDTDQQVWVSNLSEAKEGANRKSRTNSSCSSHSSRNGSHFQQPDEETLSHGATGWAFGRALAQQQGHIINRSSWCTKPGTA